MLEKLYKLHDVLLKKADEFDDVIKMGRTQMQDAAPIRLGQESYAYSKAVERDIKRIKSTSSNLLTVNLGGTAIGDRKSVVSGKSVDLGGGRIINKKNKYRQIRRA